MRLTILILMLLAVGANAAIVGDPIDSNDSYDPCEAVFAGERVTPAQVDACWWGMFYASEGWFEYPW